MAVCYRPKEAQEIPFSSINGAQLGHAQDLNSPTGCTVVITKDGAVAGVDIRGGAPGTRETDLLAPETMVEKIHAVVLAGGSAFGLAAANGVVKYLEDNGIGFDVGVAKVPIVSSAVLYDLSIGSGTIRPNEIMGYQAATNAQTPTIPEPQGNVGAGAGATLGKLLGSETSMKGGLGTYAIQIGELKLGVCVVVNCLGDVVDSATGKILVGILSKEKNSFAVTERLLVGNYAAMSPVFSGNTTLAVVVTNAKLTKAQAKKIAGMTHDGFARVLRPSHTMVDGDTVFALSVGEVQADINVVGVLAAQVVEEAIYRAVKNASPIFGFKSYSDLHTK